MWAQTGEDVSKMLAGRNKHLSWSPPTFIGGEPSILLHPSPSALIHGGPEMASFPLRVPQPYLRGN